MDGRPGRDERDGNRRRSARTSRPILTSPGDGGPAVRRAGRAILADGRILLWSVAEGARGRRWRSSTRIPDGRLVDALLLEAGPGGRIGRLELTTVGGQLTFHAEPEERAAHGNVVTPDGVRHVALRWAPGRGIEIPWSPIADAVLASGPAGAREVARIDTDLVPRPATVLVEQLGEGHWRLGERDIRLDSDGLPLFPGGRIWPLEEPGLTPV
jgi:hypothetical protein